MMKRLMILVINLSLVLNQFICVSAKEENPKSWQSLYQYTLEHADELGLVVLEDQSILLYEDTDNNSVRPCVYEDGNSTGGYGNVTRCLMTDQGYVTYYSHANAYDYLVASQNRLNTLNSLAGSNSTGSIVAQSISETIIAYLFYSGLPATIAGAMVTVIANRTVERNRNIYSAFVPLLRSTYNSCASDQGIRVFWSSDYSWYQVNRQ